MISGQLSMHPNKDPIKHSRESEIAPDIVGMLFASVDSEVTTSQPLFDCLYCLEL